MIETLTDKTVVTRKPHICFGCLREIKKGEKARYNVSVIDGHFGHAYLCEECDEYITELDPIDCEDGFFEGQIFDMRSEED
jgi:hypothetical protein